jgi:GxxExxY protein
MSRAVNRALLGRSQEIKRAGAVLFFKRELSRASSASVKGGRVWQLSGAGTSANTANLRTLLPKTFENARARFVLLQAHMTTTFADVEELTQKVIGCAIEVHRILGPGLLESVYRECMIIEMRREHLRVDSERHVPLDYKGQRISGRLKLDLLVDDCVVLELKAVERLHPIHLAQVITYLKLTGCPAGLLMNFNSTTLRAGLRRLDHPDRYVKKEVLNS